MAVIIGFFFFFQNIYLYFVSKLGKQVKYSRYMLPIGHLQFIIGRDRLPGLKTHSPPWLIRCELSGEMDDEIEIIKCNSMVAIIWGGGTVSLI